MIASYCFRLQRSYQYSKLCSTYMHHTLFHTSLATLQKLARLLAVDAMATKSSSIFLLPKFNFCFVITVRSKWRYVSYKQKCRLTSVLWDCIAQFSWDVTLGTSGWQPLGLSVSVQERTLQGRLVLAFFCAHPATPRGSTKKHQSEPALMGCHASDREFRSVARFSGWTSCVASTELHLMYETEFSH